jgi:hypothetical protein
MSKQRTVLLGIFIFGALSLIAFQNFSSANGLYNFSSPNSLVMMEMQFDEEFYLGTNPDVAEAVGRGDLQSGFEHYLLYGLREGRSPTPTFNEAKYLASRPDVALKVSQGKLHSGFEHWVTEGQYENDNQAMLHIFNYLLED